MYHIIFNILLDTNHAEKPVIGVFCHGLQAFSAATRVLKPTGLTEP